jgi:hypothetical protein
VNILAVGVCVCIYMRAHAHIHTEFKSYLNHCLATLIFICGGKLGMFASLFQYLPTDGFLLIVVKRNTKAVNTLSPFVLC